MPALICAAFSCCKERSVKMNLQLDHVLSDMVGVRGVAILDAILAGERDPIGLAALCSRRVRSPREAVAKFLEGDYGSEHLFALRRYLSHRSTSN